jgi:HAD superfamily hydrolase (TIGR01549 family)
MTIDLAAVLARTGPILLDFDGPICSVFAGYGAPTAAGELVQLLVQLGAEVSGIKREQDPLEVLRWASRLGSPEITLRADIMLRALELRAIDTAVPTAHSDAVIRTARRVGRPVGIVSNNSEPAIRRYLKTHDLESLIGVVVGRECGDPDRMKPSPEPVVKAIRALGAVASNCALVGDSTSDIASSQAAGVLSIGFANKRHKLSQLIASGATAVVESMEDIQRALAEGRPPNRSG